ncbi:MAG: DUF2955 domain-containing protein [Myxococcota bacterium]|nr:DUF2955 domain-containing protein [Myxococcota bacterium]
MPPIDAIRTLRFAAGTTLAVAFAFGLDYSLAVVTPLLASVFLGAPSPRPTLATMAGVMAASAIGLGLGVGVGALFVNAPSLLFLAVGLLLFRIFLAAVSGTAPFLVLMLLLGVLLVPVIATISAQEAFQFAIDFLGATALSFVFVQLAFELFPDPQSQPRVAEPPPVLPPPARLAYALQRTAIFLPLFAVVVTLQWTGQLQALLFAVILSLGAQPGAGWRASLPMLGGAAIGGSAAVGIYLLTSLYHEFTLLLLLVGVALLVIGREQFSDRPRAVYFASAKTALIILIASSTSLFGDETGDKFFDRLTSILVAAGILTLGLPLAATWLRPRPRPQPQPQPQPRMA